MGTYTWSKTTVKELSLSAAVEDINGCGADIVITPDADKMYADYNIKYNNTNGELTAYFAAYKNGILVSVKSDTVNNDYLRLEIPAYNDYTYKAFLWDKQLKPLHDFVEFPTVKASAVK